MAFRVMPYKQGSRGASSLAAAIDGRVLKLRGSQWRPRREDIVINWGNLTQALPGPHRTLNPPETIRTASNKREFFNAVAAAGQQEIIPRFWTRREDIPDDSFPIVCRTVLAGHSGEGIIIADRRADLVPAPLFVEYVKKQSEFRIHVGRERRMDGDEMVIISIQQKRRSREVPDERVNWKVRNHANGFIYAREGVEPPPAVLDVARRALRCTELDFGAVDVIFNERHNRAYVLEVNTAPGLEGQTVHDYAEFFAAAR